MVSVVHPACGGLAVLAFMELAPGLPLQAQLAEVNRRKGRLYEVLEMHGREAPNLGDLSERLRALNDQARTLSRELGALEAQRAPAFGADPEEIKSLTAMLRALASDTTDVRRTRALLQSLLDSVVIDSDRVEIFYKTTVLADGGVQKLAVHSGEKWLRDQDSNLGPSDYQSLSEPSTPRDKASTDWIIWVSSNREEHPITSTLHFGSSSCAGSCAKTSRHFGFHNPRIPSI